MLQYRKIPQNSSPIGLNEGVLFLTWYSGGIFFKNSSPEELPKLEVRSPRGVGSLSIWLEDGETPVSIAASKESLLIASATISDISIIEMPYYRPITAVNYPSPLFSFSPDGRMLVVIKNGNTVDIYGIQAE